MQQISVELVFAPTATQAHCKLIDCALGSTLAELLQLPQVKQFMLDNNLLADSPVGVFCHKIKSPSAYTLQNGDRVEWYRPLIATPMTRRKMRATAMRV